MKDCNRLLEGKRVFITTGAQGAGKDITLLFAQQGIQIGVGGRDPESLTKTMEETRVYLSEGKGYVVELPSKEQVEQTAGQVLKDMRGVDILINTIGINIHGQIDEYSGELLERMLEISCKSGLRFSRRPIPGMMEGRYGIIINISSTHSMATMPGFGVYAGTKEVMNVAARVMALDYADHGTRVNTICPGLIMSDNMVDEVYGYQEGPERDAFMEMLSHVQPLAPGKMEGIPDVALYLASDMSSCVTDQIIMVNGEANIKAH